MEKSNIEKSYFINKTLRELKCSNPDCAKIEQDIRKMALYSVTIGSDGRECFGDIRISDKICCDSFKKVIEEIYNKYKNSK